MSVLKYTEIENQPVVLSSLEEDGPDSLKQIHFSKGLIPFWGPNLPVEQELYMLCYNENYNADNCVVWSKIPTDGSILFENLTPSVRDEVLYLLGIENDGYHTIVNWLLDVNEHIEFLKAEPQGLLRLISYGPDTPKGMGTGANGIFYRDCNDRVLCWSKTGWYWSDKWIVSIICLGNSVLV